VRGEREALTEKIGRTMKRASEGVNADDREEDGGKEDVKRNIQEQRVGLFERVKDRLYDPIKKGCQWWASSVGRGVPEAKMRGGRNVRPFHSL
jgi:hypothetical protein